MAHAGQDLDVCLRFEKQPPQTSSANTPRRHFREERVGRAGLMQSSLITGESFGAEIPVSGVFVCRLRRLPLPPASFHLS